MKSFVRDLDGNIRFWNRGVVQLYGWTISEAIGRSSHELLKTQFSKPLSEIVDELLETGSWHGELHQVHRDGSKLTVLSHWALDHDADGAPGIVTETNYDLTDFQQAQKELLGSQEESYHRLLELEVLYRTAQVGLGFLDHELRYIRLNEALAEMNALSVEEHLGQSARDINPALATLTVPLMERVLASRQPLLNVEVTASSPSDLTRDRTWIANFHPVANGHTFGVSVVFQDISALKESEAMRARFGVIVESSDDAMISMKLDGVVTTWNGGAERMFGYSATEIVGKPISLLSAVERCEPLSGSLARLEKGELADHYESVYRRKDGRVVDVSLTVSPIFSPQGKLIGVSETIRDISEQKRSYAALLTRNEELRQFAFAAAHDLQEPLRNIGLYAQLLKARNQIQKDEDAEQHLTTVIDSALRMQALIGDLLEYAEVVDLQGEYSQVVDCNEACRTALENLAYALKVAEADVVVSPLPSIMVDRSHVVQLFQNLLGNAVKFASVERKPQIDVSAERRDDRWVFSVKDNGIGIAPEFHERIFGVFKRLHGRDVPGTGIGLALCKRIVCHHGGHLWLQSEVGVGSTFFFSFPVCN